MKVVLSNYDLSNEKTLAKIIASRIDLIEQLFAELTEKDGRIQELEEQLKAKSKEDLKEADPVNKDWEAEEEKSDGHTDDPSA